MKSIVLFVALVGGLLLSAGCQTNTGIGLSPGMIFDSSRGTFYVAPEAIKDFKYDDLANPRESYAYQVTIPIPIRYTVLMIGFGWGDLDMQNVMVKGDMKSISYADYNRLIILGCFERYTISSYGELKPQPEI